MSALNAVAAIHRKRQEDPGLPIERLSEILAAGLGVEATFDYNAALLFYQKHPEILEIDASGQAHDEARLGILRESIAAIVKDERPRWTRTITLGRAVVQRTMSDDNAKQCLVSARLFSEDEEAFSWWDSLASEYRQEGDDQKLEIGREGERLSLEYERKRLEAAGEGYEPKWVGREDTTLGYDVLSYDVFDGAYQDIYIEVKACSGDNLIFHVTRNEWKIAKQRLDRYRFHVWSLASRELEIIGPADLAPHIPENQGKGEWEIAEIRWP